MSLGGPLATAQAQPDRESLGLWTGSWSASAQEPGPGFVPNWSEDGFADQTVRQVIRVSAGGAAARIRLSNVYGSEPLRISSATVARSADGAAVRPGSLRPVTFDGSRQAVVPAGAELASDPAWLWVEPVSTLTVTLHFAEPTGPATFHSQAAATSYRAGGDHSADRGAAAFTERTQSWYYLAGLEVLNLPFRGAVAAFGDSITDGAFSTVDGNNRYPDELAEIYAATHRPRGVVNAGIGGNRLLTDSPCFGEKGTARFARDVTGQPRVGTAVVLEGINDIQATESGFDCLAPFTPVPARALIAGYRDLIAKGHARGVRMVGATMLPYGGSSFASERGEAVRDKVNHWIRTSGAFDKVVDLDRVMAVPGNPDVLNPAYDSGDHLHPNDAGYHRMAEAIAGAVR